MDRPASAHSAGLSINASCLDDFGIQSSIQARFGPFFFLGGVVRDQVSQTVGAHNKIRENFNPWARNKLEYELKLSAKF